MKKRYNMKNPIILMSAITGKPQKEEINNYMSGVRRQGIEQVMLYPRSGCEFEYLSDEWFEAVGEFLCIAKQLNMNVWLYDEFNWPSGDAGGRVTQFEKFRLKSIIVKGENAGKVSYHSEHNSSLFGEKFFPDLLSHEAVNYFIETTHEEYYKRFGDYFGNVIKGFFTDEPSIGYCCTPSSIPYYYGIEDDYKKYFNRSFAEDLNDEYEFFCEYSYDIIGKRFNECYFEKITDWCEKHNVSLTGHLMCDDIPSEATAYNGNFLNNLSSFSIPGIDFINTDFKTETMLPLLSGVEYASGKNGAMAELFALGPCDMTYDIKRCMIYLASCFKVNHYFLISHMDMRGNMRITDYFNDCSMSQPDFEGMILLTEEAKIASEYAQKDFVPDLYIEYPTKICARYVLNKLNIQPFVDLINKLALNQIQWKYINPGDDSKNIPVIKFNDKMQYIFENIIVDSLEEIINRLNSQPVITDLNGDIPDGFFVRKYTDGSIIVINLYGKSGIYKINGQNAYIYEHDVLADSFDKRDILMSFKEKIKGVFELCYCNDNIGRMMFTDSQTALELYAKSDTEISFAVRNDVCAYLSRKKLVCTESANKLPYGLKKLYSMTQPLALKEGKYVLKSFDDYKYLPCVLVSGDFKIQATADGSNAVRLKNRQKTYTCGDFFRDFGKVEFCINVTVPNGAEGIEIVGTSLYTCVYVNDTLVGKKICSPYIYNISEKWYDKNIVLKVVQYSSIAPIFGDVKYFDEHSENIQWKDAPLPSNSGFGFKEINWL